MHNLPQMINQRLSKAVALVAVTAALLNLHGCVSFVTLGAFLGGIDDRKPMANWQN